ncbi:MAG: hypothetical protein R2849_14315 [Thermomicrobiales bacterium]
MNSSFTDIVNSTSIEITMLAGPAVGVVVDTKLRPFGVECARRPRVFGGDAAEILGT